MPQNENDERFLVPLEALKDSPSKRVYSRTLVLQKMCHSWGLNLSQTSQAPMQQSANVFRFLDTPK